MMTNCYYEVEMELMNMILLSIPNEIYNSVDSCNTAKEMWARVERLMRGTIQNQVEVKRGLQNEFDQFVAEPGESLLIMMKSYELMMSHFHSDDHMALLLLVLAKLFTQNFSNPTNNPLRASSNTINQAVVQGDRVNIQSRNFGNVGRNNRRAYVQEEVIEGLNATNETANVQRIVRTLTPGNTSTGQCYNCGGKGHYARNCPKPRVRDVSMVGRQNCRVILVANICLMARIQPADQNSDDEPSYESAFVSEVQSSSINENDEQINTCSRNAYDEAPNSQQDLLRRNLLRYHYQELKLRMKNGEKMCEDQRVEISHCQDPVVLDVSKNEAKKEAVYVRKNKQTDNTFAKVVSNKENVIDVAVANASKAKTLLCDTKSSETTLIAPKTRFSKTATQSKTLDTTSVDSKSKIDEGKGHQKLEIGLGYNLFSVGQFCDGDLEVAFCSKTCYVQNLEGDDLLTGGCDSNLYTISILDMAASSPICIMSNSNFNKVHGSLCYPINDRDDLGKMKPKADIGVFIGYSENIQRGVIAPVVVLEAVRMVHCFAANRNITIFQMIVNTLCLKWSFDSSLADVMQDILQVLDYTRYGIGPTAIADNANNILNSRRNKNKVGMRILAWMITDEMKLTEHYKMYVECQQQKSDVLIFTRHDSCKSLAEHKSHVARTRSYEKLWHWYTSHLAAEEIEMLVEEPRRIRKVPEVEDLLGKGGKMTTKDTDTIVIPVMLMMKKTQNNVEVFELRRRRKGRNVEEGSIWIRVLQHLKKVMPWTISDHLAVFFMINKFGDQVPVYLAVKGLIWKGKRYRRDDQDVPHDEVHLRGRIVQNSVEDIGYETYVSGESSSIEMLLFEEPGASTRTDRQRCTSGDEHQYHIDQASLILAIMSDIVWEREGNSLSLASHDKNHTLDSKMSKRSECSSTIF
ncbi:retrovirus-related pol polyprotein from transposon TNT 1-94 [Tanacetum coccineum]